MVKAAVKAAAGEAVEVAKAAAGTAEAAAKTMGAKEVKTIGEDVVLGKLSCRSLAMFGEKVTNAELQRIVFVKNYDTVFNRLKTRFPKVPIDKLKIMANFLYGIIAGLDFTGAKKDRVKKVVDNIFR